MMFGPPDDRLAEHRAVDGLGHQAAHQRRAAAAVRRHDRAAGGDARRHAARSRSCAGTPSAGTTTSARSDWDEFKRVIKGDGPCNAQRIAQPPAARTRTAPGCARPPPPTRKQHGRPNATSAADRGRHGTPTTASEGPTGRCARAGRCTRCSCAASAGLNHVHVGSLHAADPQMALHHARDLYTRRNEGVSIWVVARRRHHRVQPGREGPVLRAERRQGVPAPDVLRHSRQRAAHVRCR